MNIFGHLFAVLFRQKTRITHRVWLLQLVAVLVTMIIVVWGTEITRDTLMNAFGLCFFLLFFVSNAIYLLVTCWQNEKFNRSQTWRLVPVKDRYIYLANTFSSFIAFVYLDVLEVIEFFLGLFCLYPASKYWLNETGQFIGKIFSGSEFGKAVEVACVLLLMGLAVYLIVSFLNFSQRALIDFWPAGSSKLVIFLTRLLLIIVVSWLVINGWQILAHLDANIEHVLFNIPYRYLPDYNNKINLSGDLGLFLLFDIVTLFLNMVLLDKFVEARPNN
ncbi:hypothetical protein PT285_03260 [Lactobacillus sp. ESL0791]|uniref:hypothetical protein n=1 Tax=Lactobacillus sp. ESL0791 TaxID=2983234 RepID=UPI0023F9D42E|nr:hypothetical protein [Lactobacillus sp. ESL0791]MDF7638453.1 hypothetical protein [Lactobacillus sp. ESL0791]